MRITSCKNGGSVTSPTYAGGILGYCAANEGDKEIADCVNTGKINSNSSAGGILGGYFSFNVGVENDGKTRLVHCINGGEISGNTVGGIVGEGLDIIVTVSLENCVNEGEVKGATRAGGILGNDAIASITKTEQSLFYINGCANLGSVSLGDGQQPFAAVDSASPAQNGDAYGQTMMLLGGKCLGGITGSMRQSRMEGCVNAGLLYADTGSVFAGTTGDMASLMEDENSPLVFAGGLCGQYMFLESNTLDNSGIRSCIYENTAPISHSTAGQFGGEDSVADNSAVDAAAAKQAAEQLT